MIQDLQTVDLVAMEVIHGQVFDPGQAWTVQSFQDLVTMGCYGWGYQQDGILQGFLMVRQILDEAEIITIAVATPCQGHGVGRCLISYALDFLRQQTVRHVHLEVAADNAAAIGLYQKLGFRLSGKRANYYHLHDGRQVDAMLMVTDLSANDTAGAKPVVGHYD